MSSVFNAIYDNFTLYEKEIERIGGEENFTEEMLAKKIFKEKVLTYIKENEIWYDDERAELYTFLNMVLPVNRKKYFIFLTDIDGTRLHLEHKRRGHINALCALIDYPASMLYHLTSFTEWTTDDYISGDYTSICIDIDDIDFPFDTKTVSKYEVQDFLINKYNLHNMPKFQAASLSGNGCHIYFCFKQMNDVKLRQKYVNSLLTVFGGDKNTSPPSHKFRVPGSMNLKDPENPKKSRLFLYDTEVDDISYLDPYLKTQEEINEYFAYCNKQSSDKRKKTAAENRQKKVLELQEQGFSADEIKEIMKPKCGRKKKSDAEKASAKNSKRYSKIVKEKSSQKTEKKEPKISYQQQKPTEAVDENLFDFESLHYKTIFSNENYCFNVLLDLHNYLKRHGNDALVGKRNFFFHCLTTFAKRTRMFANNCEGFIEYCEKYYVPVEHPFHKEMVDIITLNYRPNKKYRYCLHAVAERLEFTEEDFLMSHNSFREDIRIERRSQYNHNYYEQNKPEHIKNNIAEREAIIKFIADNPQIKRAKICDIFAISKATYYRYKAIAQECCENNSQ